ncbi:MAG: RsmB/NOP family class I SAM-dependent RNA methyltransferase, partial [Frankia sp.]
LAWEVLRAVDEQGAYANLLLPSLLTERRLDLRERALATELAYGTLRMTGTLDALLDTVSSRPTSEIDPPVRDALRLGAYQLVRTRIPAHAAVASTVELVRGVAGERPVGFANAVMRRLAVRVAAVPVPEPVSEPDPAASGPAAERGPAASGPVESDLVESESGAVASEKPTDFRPDRRDSGAVDLTTLLDAPAASVDPYGRLAILTSHPQWIVRAFGDALGNDLDALAAALAADDQRPLVHLVVRPGQVSRDDLLAEARAAGLSASPTPWSPYGVRLDGGDPARLPSVAAGRAAVQDEGSQLVAEALAATAPEPPAGSATTSRRTGLTVDLCAGPGGKAALLAGLLPAGEWVVGLEPRATRARMVAASGVLVVRADGRHPPLAPGSADRVLVDAPCTGLGALRRRPEARWRRSVEDVTALAALQRELLIAAIGLTRPGGVIAYATCSPHPAETTAVVEAVVAAVASDHPVRVLDARSALPGVPSLGDGPFVQLWPHLHGTDAMFLALLRREH